MAPMAHEALLALLALLTAVAATATRAELRVDFVAATAAHEYSARSYRSIWEQDGARIVAALESRSCLRFPEQAVTALIDDITSHSGGPDHPMGLRSSYDLDTKRATLVHELGHRHLWQLVERLDELDGHRTLYLILEQVWADVWGEEFAAERVSHESQWRAGYDYAAAWEWARDMSIDQRGMTWNRLLRMNGMRYCHAIYLEPKPPSL